jgi:MFS family permease
MPGFRATVAALSVGQILSWAALYYTFTSFVLPMQAELGWGRSTLMGAYTLGLAMWAACAVAAGSAIDRGHGRAVMSAGALLAAAGFVAWSRASEPWMLYAAQALLGVAMAMLLYEPAFAVLTQREPERYREGIAVLTLVGGFASTLAFPAAAALIAALGWRAALLVIAAVLALVVAPLHGWALGGAPAAGAPPQSRPRTDATLGDALRDRVFWLLAAAFTLYSFAQAAVWAHVVPALDDKGLTDADALAVLMCIGPAQVAGRVFNLWVGARWPLHRLGTAVMAGLPIALALFAFGSTLVPLLAFALLFGFANGQVTIVRGAIVPALFGRANVGRIAGAMTSIAIAARAAAPLAATALLALLAGYRGTLLALAALGVFAVLAFACARR